MGIETPRLDRKVENGEAELGVRNAAAAEQRWIEDAAPEAAGASPGRLEGVAKVTGRARYTTDVQLPGQLYAAVLRSPHPHARIRAVHTEAAQALPGVRAIIDAFNVPDIPWYKEQVSLLSQRVRFAGDEVAAVAAQTRAIAEDALRLIEVDYSPLKHVVEMDAAALDDAPTVHGESNQAAKAKCYSRGDIEAGWRAAQVQVDACYSTPCALHNCLEPHASVAIWEGDTLTLYDSTQGIHAVRDKVAATLGLHTSQVRVICEHMGGGFGSKQTVWKQAVLAALLARRTGAPVQLVLDREAENLATGNRNPTRQRVRLGARSDGTLTAIELDATLGIGAYQPEGETSNVAGPFQHLYRCDNVSTRQQALYLNTGPAAAFRAPGYVEGSFALESAMDELAVKLGLDPLELRRRNYTDRDQTADREWSSPEALEICYRRLDEHFCWRDRQRPAPQKCRRRGFGFAAHEWVAGMGDPPAYVWLTLNPDASLELVTGTQDIGTGTRTVLAQIAAKTLGLPLDCVRVTLGDTASGPLAPVSQGSFTVPTLAPAVFAAADNIRTQLLAAAASLLSTDCSTLRLVNGRIRDDSDEPVLDIATVTGKLAPHRLQGHGSREANRDDVTIRTFGAMAVEVEVDTQTGEITVVRVVDAPDCGRILNPRLATSQVIGGVTQGIGFALMEGRVADATLGLVLNANLEDYRIATVADVPDITHAQVDLPDLRANPTGCKGLGELPLIPVAAAIANAVFDATGARLRELPFTRARVLAALKERQRT